MKEDAPALVQKLLQQLLESEKYGDRKGAAYGLAGLVKGMGILVLKQLDIMSTLTNAIQDKKNYRRREGKLSILIYRSKKIQSDIEVELIQKSLTFFVFYKFAALNFIIIIIIINSLQLFEVLVNFAVILLFRVIL